MSSQWCIIANPAAGRGRARRAAAAASRVLGERGARADVHLTAGPGHAADLAAAAVDSGASHLVVCGGDGTVAEVLPAALASGLPLGLVPTGRGNDLARALGLPRRLRPALAALAAAAPRAVDTGAVNGRPFATVSSLGLDAEVSRVMRERRLPLPGSAAYVSAALHCLSSFQPFRVCLSGDFGRFEEEVLLIAGANTASYGGGMRIAPAADPGDGLLDLCVVRAVPRRQVIAVMPRVFWGGHVHHPAVTVLRSRRVSIEVVGSENRPVWADGEAAAHTPAVLEVRPAALQVLVPAPAGGTLPQSLPGARQFA